MKDVSSKLIREGLIETNYSYVCAVCMHQTIISINCSHHSMYALLQVLKATIVNSIVFPPAPKKVVEGLFQCPDCPYLSIFELLKPNLSNIILQFSLLFKLAIICPHLTLAAVNVNTLSICARPGCSLSQPCCDYLSISAPCNFLFLPY